MVKPPQQFFYIVSLIVQSEILAFDFELFISERGELQVYCDD